MLLLLVLLISLFAGCSCDINYDSKQLSVLSYNTQNLFDATLDGSEYDEYQNTKVWNERAYRMRLTSLAKVLLSKELNSPDVIVLQEVEGETVVIDLLSSHLAKKGYCWYAVAKGEDAAISVAIISRRPILGAYVHGGSSIRPVLQVDLDTELGPVSILALHAKSNLGDDTQALRLETARVVKQAAMNLLANPILICGDFNEDPSVIWEGTEMQPALVDVAHPDANRLLNTGSLGLCGYSSNLAPTVFYSPYLDPLWKGTVQGSCNWDGTWHCYDQILASNRLFDGLGWEYEGFSIGNLPLLSNSDGRPYAWNLKTLSGYSDHFPVLMTLRRR